jgi:hypothetical protein
MRPRYFIMLLAFLLTGCTYVNRSQHLRPGSVYVNNHGSLIEVGADGKAHKMDMPLDQWPQGLGATQ